MPLMDRAKSVLLDLGVAGLGKRPLVFITHSMGGLLVKQLLRTANESPAKSPEEAILKNTRGVCFIATLHIGSDLAKWASYFRTTLGTNISIQELEPHGPLLRELNEFYRNLVTRRGVNIKTLTFYEKKPLFGGTLVVAEGDADPGVPQSGLYAQGEDHQSICKPRSKSATIHRKLVEYIRDDCLQLSAPPPPLPGQTHAQLPSAGKPPWPDELIVVLGRRKPYLPASIIGAALVACVLFFKLRNHDGQGPDQGGQTKTEVSDVASNSGSGPAKILDNGKAASFDANLDVEPDRAELGGYVSDEATGQPLEGVPLSLLDYDDIHGKTPMCRTDAEGRFRFRDLPASRESSKRVKLIARKDGYQQSDTYSSLGATAIPVTLQPATTPEHDR